MKRERTPVMNLYEWSLTSWTTSDARTTLDATGRGIYRELLDWCYAQGRIPADHVKMARYAACTPEVFEQYWPVLKRYFKPVKNEPNALENAVANAQRRQYFAFVKEQQRRGRKGGKTRGKSKPEESQTSEAVASQESDSRLKPTRQDKTKQDKTQQEKIARVAALRPLDEQWGVFVEACLAVGVDGSRPDWQAAEKFGWAKLDFGQRISAVQRLRELRNYPEEAWPKCLPGTYLEKQAWDRPLRGKPAPKEVDYPTFRDDSKDYANE